MFSYFLKFAQPIETFGKNRVWVTKRGVAQWVRPAIEQA